MRISLGLTLAASRKTGWDFWWHLQVNQFPPFLSDVTRGMCRPLSILMKISLWLGIHSVFYMVVATHYINSGSAWAETNSTPPGISDVIQTDLEMVKEDLRFLQEETVSIAAQREQSISEVPSNVYVITDEDIRHSGAIDLPMLFRRIPGMEVMQVTSAEYNVSVRGDNQLVANKLLVMIDGRSIYEDAYGSVFWTTLPITLPEIKRIEVLKGPAAAIYGFNAFDGVINIITKSPDEIKGSVMQVGGGELGTIRASAIHAGKHEKFGYRFSVGHDQNQQWRDRDALALRQTKFNIHTQYALPSESMVSLQGGFLSNNRYDGQTFGTIAETTTGITSGFLNALYKRPNFFIRGWWSYWRHENAVTINPLISPFFQIFDKTGDGNQERERNTYNVDIQHDWDFASSHHLTYGMNLRTTIFTSNFLTSTKTHEDRVGLYIQEEWQPIKEVTASAGIRFDLHSQINPTYSPRLVLIYRPAPDHAIRISGSVAYRPPTLFETFIDARSMLCFGAPCPGGSMVSRNFIGNKNLKPEQIISYEIEYQGWYLQHRLRFRSAFFYNQISDLITFNVPSPINQTQKADIFGGEAGVEFLATPWLSGYINMSYEQIGQDFIGPIRRGAPRFKYNGGLRVELENGLNGEASLFYVGSAKYPIENLFSISQGFAGGQPAPDQRIGSFFLLSLRGAYKFWKERAEVAVTIHNALNDKHKEHPLGDVIGSQVLGWLTLKY